MRQAACLRGRGEQTNFSLEVVSIGRNELVRSNEADELAETETARQALFRNGLALIGMSRKDSSARDRAQTRARLIGGFYDRELKRITVVGSGPALDSAGYTLLLVHEMIHALQDRAGELAEHPVRLDRAFAVGAIVEGEATLLQDEALMEGLGVSFEDIQYEKVLREYRQGELAQARNAREPMLELGMNFRYAEGASYLWPTRRDQGAAALAAAHATPAVSTYAIMTHELAKSQARPNDLGDSALPVLPGLTLLGSLHLGRFGYEVARTTFQRLHGTWLLPEGEHFVADTFSVFSTPAQTVLASWRVRFDDEQTAREAAARLAMFEDPIRSGLDGRDVWFIVSEDESSLAALPELLEWQAAAAEDFGYEADTASRGHLHCRMPIDLSGRVLRE